ncbi:MAG: carboxypeptidase-like regulatory domain-containing protein [Aestuariibaculum sp.]
MIKIIKNLTYISLLCFFSLPAQEVIEGLVKNNKEIPIENASIVIKNTMDAIVTYGYTNKDGFFSINSKFENNNEFKLVVNSLGYKEYTVSFVSVNEKLKKFNIVMLEKPLELSEVVLTPDQKITSNNNVTTLKTEYFTDETEQTVEDVLKKLPGVEVLDDGSIKAHGKFISKLLIEGDDVFSNNYQILSKNLDAKALNAVEIIDEFQDNPLLAKVIESDMVALNLKLKEDFKNIWFGNASAGLGTKERAKLSANLGLLRKKIKFFYFGDYNNLGHKASEQLSGAPTSLNLTSLYQEKEIEPKTEPLYLIEKNENNLFTDGQSIFNDAFMSSLGFSTKMSPNLELRGFGAFTKDDQDQLFFAETIYNVEANPISFTENSITNHVNKIASGEIELKYTGGNKSYLKNTLVYNNQPELYKNKILYNNSDNISQNLKKNNYSIYNHLNYGYLLGQDNILHNYIYLGQNKIEQDIEIHSPLLNNLLSVPENSKIDYLSNDKISVFGLSSNLISSFGNFKHVAMLEYESTKETRSNEFIDNDSLDSLQNNLHFKTNKIKLGSSLAYSFSEKVKLSVGASLNRIKIDIDTKKSEIWFFNPEVKLDLRKLKFGFFKINYSNTYDLPKSMFFLNNYQLANYKSFVRGSKNINLIKGNLFNVYYKWANKLESQAFTIHFKYNETAKKYSTDNQIEDNFIFSSYKIYEGGTHISSNINFTSYFKKLNLSTNLRTNQSWSVVPLQINSQEFSNLKNHISSYLFSGTTYFNIPFNFTFKIILNRSLSNFNSIISKTHWENGALNITYNLSKEWVFSLNNNTYFTENDSYYFLNSKINYQPKKSNFSYQLIANNLTNETSFSNTIINDYSIYNSNIKLLPRYIFASVKYRF